MPPNPTRKVKEKHGILNIVLAPALYYPLLMAVGEVKIEQQSFTAHCAESLLPFFNQPCLLPFCAGYMVFAAYLCEHIKVAITLYLGLQLY